MAYDENTTADEVLEGVDLEGKVVLVTGATSGLGLEASRALAAHGAEVVLSGRDPEKLDEALDALRSQVSGTRVSAQLMDLASLADIRSAAAQVRAGHERIDLLINNAGVMACPFSRTDDGFEMQFGTNHLGHFLFTNLLLDPLLAAPNPRIVCLSSAGHRESPILWDDPNFEHTEYFNWTAYGQSKTANALFALELDRRFAPDGLHAFSVHPGVIPTPLARHLTEADLAWMASRPRRGDVGGMKFKSVEAGAATTVWAATSPELESHGGAYLADCQVSPKVAERDGINSVDEWACDPAGAERLWELSAQLVGLTS